MTCARAVVTLRHPTGLHARPAVKLTRLAKRFEASIRLRGGEGDLWVDAKSIVKVMGLKLPSGSSLEFEVEGEDAEDVLAELTALVARDFDEAR